jgi:hypothetical protein
LDIFHSGKWKVVGITGAMNYLENNNPECKIPGIHKDHENNVAWEEVELWWERMSKREGEKVTERKTKRKKEGDSGTKSKKEGERE